MDDQEPLGAGWALRDAFECAIKFSACVAVADVLQTEPDDETAAKLVKTLMKPMSMGDWYNVLTTALRPLKPLLKNGQLDKSGRCLPALAQCFFEPNGKPSELSQRIGGNEEAFVTWRNQVFGHGVFKSDRQFYAKEAIHWLPVLQDFYTALEPVLKEWRLVSFAADGQLVTWQGTGSLRPAKRHEHVPLGKPVPMALDPPGKMVSGQLSFGALLSVQQCATCDEHAAFFFDRHEYKAKKKRHLTCCLEYFRGHRNSRIHNWDETLKWVQKLPQDFVWTREGYVPTELAEAVRVKFRGFDDEYLRPDYLLDAFWETVNSREKGYVHLVGPGGMGKTYFVRGLADREGDAEAPVLPYYVLSNESRHYQTFIQELKEKVRDRLNYATPEIQVKGLDREHLQEEFGDFVAQLMRGAGLTSLVIAIDALDELPEPEAGSLSIMDFLPTPDRLPDGCHVLLTSRSELRPAIRRHVDRIRGSSEPDSARTDLFTLLDVAPDTPDNQALIRSYLRQNLPDKFRTDDHVEEVLRRCESVFLYACHFSQALEGGVYDDVSELPRGAEFYSAYIERLRERVGDRLFDDTYMPTLLRLCAAQAPVTLRQLQAWGVPGDRLMFALMDLSNFLVERRVRLWHESLVNEGETRYEIKHDSLKKFLQKDKEHSDHLQSVHQVIARSACAAHAGHWGDADPEDDADLYDLRFVMAHFKGAGKRVGLSSFLVPENYADACREHGLKAAEAERYKISLDLFGCAHTVYDNLVNVAGRDDLANRLATTLMNKGVSLRSLGRFDEAITCYDEAIGIWWPMVEPGRDDLANTLATTLMNKGVSLKSLGRFDEAIACYDEAIDILKPMVEAGRDDLANQLAGALTNKSALLNGLGRFDEAIACCDEAIGILKPMVEAGRDDLANRLADTLTNKGATLLLKQWGDISAWRD